jgi:hypothetical protein
MEQLKKVIGDNMRTIDSQSSDADSLLAELVASPLVTNQVGEASNQAIELREAPPLPTPQILENDDPDLLHSIPLK